MKYLFSLLVIVLLSGCGSPAGRTLKKIGTAVNQCCANLPFAKESPLTGLRSSEPEPAGRIAVAVFEPQMQLIHTW
jgi:hypothetical protein